MFTRELPSLSLADVYERVSPSGEVVTAPANTVRLVLADEHPLVVVSQPARKSVEIPHSGALPTFGDLLNIPSAFLNRLPLDLSTRLVNDLLERESADIAIRYTPESIQQVTPADQKSVDPRAIVEIAERVVSTNAQVASFWLNGRDFHLDVVVPADYDRGIIGDPKIGDISLGGLRFEQDLKRNLAPGVQEFWMRLSCLNGAERYEKGERVDFRGNDPDDFLAEFEQLADAKFRQVEETMRHFYSLRERTVPSVEQAVIRFAEEAGLTDRVKLALVKLVPEAVDPDREPTLFDVSNLFTNTALDPSLKAGVRQQLERVAGQIVADEAARCRSCASRLL